MKSTLFICICFFLIFPVESRPAFPSNKDWAREYNRLEQRISKNFGEPEGAPAQLESYIRWMGIKAKDRDEVKALLEEVNRLSFQNPKDQELEKWTQKFFYLLERAQDSGINTVNGACMKFMYVRDSQFPKRANWQVIIWRLQRFGREIYTNAQKTGFVSTMIKARAKCMINFSIRDVEGNPHDGKKWETEADSEGNYEIKDVILHKDCSPSRYNINYQRASARTHFFKMRGATELSAKYNQCAVLLQELTVQCREPLPQAGRKGARVWNVERPGLWLDARLVHEKEKGFQRPVLVLPQHPRIHHALFERIGRLSPEAPEKPIGVVRTMQTADQEDVTPAWPEMSPEVAGHGAVPRAAHVPGLHLLLLGLFDSVDHDIRAPAPYGPQHVHDISPQ
jgi:hypothetical protein